MRMHGFTLIELLVSLAVAAVLAAFAIPAFSSALEATRAGGVESTLVASLTQAGHRAALTGTPVVLCPSLDSQACRSGTDWSAGWVAFHDLDRNRERSPGEPLLAQVPALGGKVRLRSTSGRTRIVFQGYGGNAGSNATFTLCDGRGAAYARTLVLNNRGALRSGDATSEGAAATCVP